MSKRGKSTEQIHHAYQPPSGWGAVPVPIYKASTVLFPDTAALHQPRSREKVTYRYGLQGTPSSLTLAARVATLEQAQHCILVPSGLAAITLPSMAMLKPGDEVLLPDNVYGQNRYVTTGLLSRLGITHQFYDPLDAAGFERLLNERTRLVWLEAAGSITMEFPDLLGLLRACKARGVSTAMDNTWGAGMAFNAFELAPGLGVDISMQALTKFASGGADVLMGAVCTRDARLHRRLDEMYEFLGYGVGQNDVEAVLRGLPSLPLRYRAQEAAALELATWMQQQPAVARVLHPALPGSPGHAYWKQVSTGGSSCLFSAVFKPGYCAAQVDAFVDALTCFGIGYSWAGPMSLAVPYDLTHSRDLPLPWSPQEGGTLVRFAIGLEELEDLRADLAQALAVLG
ncbi:PLP-dependent transferase [Roseateles sp. SL47]|uniref:PLP-dependent transferase n=1 Tax=Roseateles sp. SL47 TaxID=2995138 RepID=UPI0022713DDE|nr:PLP-dependent transferase [Roseateles sp. SL47]WAC75695.1 PLP-dependent transferase [Roseateles sp. SL47]